YPYSGYVFPGDDLKYLTVNQYLTGNEPSYQKAYSTSTSYFVVVSCGGGAARVDCGQPTGETELRTEHLPVRGWNIDVDVIANAVKKNNMSLDDGSVVITTVGRMKVRNYFPYPIVSSSANPADALSGSADSRPIAIFLEKEKPTQLPSSSVATSHFI